MNVGRWWYATGDANRFSWSVYQRDLCACVLQVGTHYGVLQACRPSDQGHLGVLKIQHDIIMTWKCENPQLVSKVSLIAQIKPKHIKVYTKSLCSSTFFAYWEPFRLWIFEIWIANEISKSYADIDTKIIFQNWPKSVRNFYFSSFFKKKV